MEELNSKIKQTAKLIARSFYGLWIGAISLWLLFLTDILPLGIVDGQSQTVYYIQIVGVLITLPAIPLSLRNFHRYVGTLQEKPLMERLACYQRASLWRLTCLGIPFFYNLLLYFLTLNRAPGMLALIVLLATIFCIPDKKRLIHELNIPEQ